MDEWERIESRYNETKDSDWSGRDFESLRCKFKMLCTTKKPTGEPDIPGHIKTAKDIREEIDKKAGVVDCDDAPDVDDDMVVYDTPIVYDAPVVDDEVGFDHEFEFLEAEEEKQGDTHAVDQTPYSVGPAQYWAPVEGHYTHDVAHGMPAFASMPFQTERRPATPPLPVARTKRRADEDEARRYPKMKDYSNRLGGTPLPSVDEDRREKSPSKSEASFTKQKKVRAERAIVGLRQQFQETAATATEGRNDMLRFLVMMREVGERKAEAHRSIEDERRREDHQMEEDRRRAEREDSEERRCAEIIEADERRRAEKEEAHARPKELMVLMSTVMNNKN